MDQRDLAGLKVPIVGMGTSGTLDVPDDEIPASKVVVEAALDHDSTFFDSSPMYGRAEHVLAVALGERRRDAVIATKVWTADDSEAERQIAASLAFYGGRVEVFQIHNLVSWQRRLEQLERERDKGTIDLIGATHWQVSGFAELEEVMRTGRIQCIQIPYNPIERDVEARILPLAADSGIGVIVMRPFARAALMQRAPSAADLEPLAPYGVTTWAQALLKWGLSDRRTTVSIPATSKPERAVENAVGGSGDLFDDDARRLVARLAGA
jgi:aryl-alcohol dehydrogenase-like predicted oxidoreductase